MSFLPSRFTKFQSLEISSSQTSSLWKFALLLVGVAALTGCELRRAMYDQPKIARPNTKSEFFKDGQGSRLPVEGTVQWSAADFSEDTLLNDGKENGAEATRYPLAITAEDLARGKERFEIFCTPCHDRAGTGNGMIVQRGFKAPPSFHQDRLRTANPGYFYNVIKNGFGQMPDYAAQIPAPDRWRITAYIRALQLSQNADPKDLPQELASQLTK
jgi:mono/diheme cytochrome c family protein